MGGEWLGAISERRSNSTLEYMWHFVYNSQSDNKIKLGFWINWTRFSATRKKSRAYYFYSLGISDVKCLGHLRNRGIIERSSNIFLKWTFFPSLRCKTLLSLLLEAELFIDIMYDTSYFVHCTSSLAYVLSVIQRKRNGDFWQVRQDMLYVTSMY